MIRVLIGICAAIATFFAVNIISTLTLVAIVNMFNSEDSSESLVSEGSTSVLFMFLLFRIIIFIVSIRIAAISYAKITKDRQTHSGNTAQ